MVDAEHLPLVAVLDHEAPVGVQLAVVLAGGDLIADVQAVVATDRRPGRVDLALPDAQRLGPAVEVDDDLGGGRHHGHAVAPGPGLRPRLHLGLLHLAAGPAVDAPVLVVEVEGLGVAPAQAQAGVALPVVGEAVDPVQLDGPVAVDEVAEHARATQRGELQGVADQGQAPAPGVGQVGQLGQLGGRDHGRFVDHDGGTRGKGVAVVGRAVEAVLD